MYLTLLTLVLGSGCDKIDNKVVPSFVVQLPSNFPYNVNTYTGYGGVLLMMGLEMPMAYDLSCPVEMSRDVILTINPDNYDAVCPRCGSRFNPLTGAGGPLSGVAINNKVGMRQYRVIPSNGGYIIAN